MSSKKDYYEILGVSKGSTPEQIRKAYRELVLKCHPDRADPGKKKEAEERFKEISEAYAVLSDTEKRALYDRYGHEEINRKYTDEDLFRGANFGQAFEGFGDDLFGSLFGDLFGGSRFGKRKDVSRTFTMEIDLEEAAFGCEKTVRLPGETDPLTVRIPPGVDTGSALSLSGNGKTIFITVQVRSHPYFKREGSNLLIQKTISLTQAILGGEVEVRTLSGRVFMKIPPGTQPGKVFRLKGKGMPSLQKSIPGDELVIINVEIPSHISSEQQKLIEEFEKASKAA